MPSASPNLKMFTYHYVERLLDALSYIEDLANTGLEAETFHDMETALLVIKHYAADPLDVTDATNTPEC
jgi:hypothetical protein